MYRHISIIIAAISFFSLSLASQNHINIEQTLTIDIQEEEADSGPILRLDKLGLLLPRMDSMDIHAIANPAEGLMVLDTTNFCLFVYHNQVWRQDCSFIPLPASASQDDPERNYMPVYEANEEQVWKSPNGYAFDFHQVLFNATSTDIITDISGTAIFFTEDLDPSDSFDGIRFTAPVSGHYFFSTHLTFDKGNSPLDNSNTLAINLQANTGSNDVARVEISPEVFTFEGKEMASSLNTVFHLPAGNSVLVSLSGAKKGNEIRILERVFSGYLLTKD